MSTANITPETKVRLRHHRHLDGVSRASFGSASILRHLTATIGTNRLSHALIEQMDTAERRFDQGGRVAERNVFRMSSELLLEFLTRYTKEQLCEGFWD